MLAVSFVAEGISWLKAVRHLRGEAARRDRGLEIDAVLELRTMLVGPATLLVAARVDLDDTLDARGVEDATDRIDAALRARFPEVQAVYLDPTSRRGQVAASAPDPTSASTTDPTTTR